MEQAQTTATKPEALNYHHYTTQKYDQEIQRVIPGYREVHREVLNVVRRQFRLDKIYRVLDLGVGTGLTSAMIQSILPRAIFDVIDFSRSMLKGARTRLDPKRTNFILGDYAKTKLPSPYDLIVSVIGLHHQTDDGKRKMIRRMVRALKPGGYIVLADLMTHQDPQTAALCQAQHLHHLVSWARSRRMLAEWAHHHLYLNQLATVEDHLRWFKRAGIHAMVRFHRMNTVVLVARKPKRTPLS